MYLLYVNFAPGVNPFCATGTPRLEASRSGQPIESTLPEPTTQAGCGCSGNGGQDFRLDSGAE
jgi:hypothetical protein